MEAPIGRHGYSKEGTKRYICRNITCSHSTFMRDYIYPAYQPEVRGEIIEMTLNASGIRDTARVLKISPTTVIKALKDKEDELESVNRSLFENVKNPDKLQVIISRCEEAELDEMWSFVHDKGNQRWLWHAIDHKTGKVLAYVFGGRKGVVFKNMKALLEPFGIRHYYTDDWAAYSRYLDEAKHHIGKKNTKKFSLQLYFIVFMISSRTILLPQQHIATTKDASNKLTGR